MHQCVDCVALNSLFFFSLGSKIANRRDKNRFFQFIYFVVFELFRPHMRMFVLSKCPDWFLFWKCYCSRFFLLLLVYCFWECQNSSYQSKCDIFLGVVNLLLILNQKIVSPKINKLINTIRKWRNSKNWIYQN